MIFWGPSACYDVTIGCLDRPVASSSLKLAVNQKVVARWTLDETDDAGDGRLEKVVPAVHIQRLSRITLEGQSPSGRCRIRDVSFEPVGPFQGDLLPEDQLRTPPSLRIFQSFDQRASARNMLGEFISQKLASAEQRRGAVGRTAVARRLACTAANGPGSPRGAPGQLRPGMSAERPHRGQA